MKIIRPVLFDPTLLISTNATEIYSNWVSGNTYHDGDRVLHQELQNGVTTSRIWECVANNTTTEPSSTNAAWSDLGPGNKHAMFDNQISTKTTTTGNLVFVIKVGSVDSLGFLNISGSKIQVEIKETFGGTTLYDETKSLVGNEPLDWYEYFYYEAEEQRTSAIFTYPTLLPATAHAYVTVTNSVAASVGHCTFGKSAELGLTQYGLNSGIQDYSRKETDEFGVTTFVPRAFSKRMSVQLDVSNLDVSKVTRILQNVRATPCLYIASDDPVLDEAVILFGFYKDFGITISYPTRSVCSLELEGLT